MCIRCYEEFFEDGEAKPPTTFLMLALAALIQDFYEYEITGGELHIVLDDWNLDDDYIHWCMCDENVIHPGDRRETATSIASGLLALSLEQRYEVMRLADV